MLLGVIGFRGAFLSCSQAKGNYKSSGITTPVAWSRSVVT